MNPDKHQVAALLIPTPHVGTGGPDEIVVAGPLIPIQTYVFANSRVQSVLTEGFQA